MQKSISFIRSILSFILVCSFIVLSFSMFTVSAEENTGDTLVLNVFNWGEYIDDGSGEGCIQTDHDMDVIAEFEKYYEKKYGKKVDVVYSNYENNEDLYAKLKAGGSNYDIVIPSDYMINRLIKEDMLEKINYENIPNYKNIDEDFKDNTWSYDPTHEYSVPYLWGVVGLVYNSKVVKGDVSSWDILWDETYKNKVLMFNNPRDTFAIALSKVATDRDIDEKLLNTNDATYWKYAYELLEEQKEKVNPSYVTDENFNKMESGEAVLAPCYYGDYMRMKSNNQDLMFSDVFKNVVNKYVDAFCIPKGAEHKELAEQFIDFMCSKEVAMANAEFTAYSTPSTEVVNDSVYHFAGDPIAYPDKSRFERHYEEFLYLGEGTQEIMDNYWNKLKKETGGVWIYITLAVVVVGAVLVIVSRKIKARKIDKYFEENNE